LRNLKHKTGHLAQGDCSSKDEITSSTSDNRPNSGDPGGLFRSIPGELRCLPQWVTWRYQERGGRRTKVPYQAGHPHRKASPTDPATWSSFAKACKAAATADGIGFVFSADDPYVGIDLDEPLDDLRSAALLLCSYTEESVGGEGLHVILKGSLEDVDRRRYEGVEVYEVGRYFCMTGKHLPGSPATIEERQTQLDDFLSEFLPPNAAKPGPRNVTNSKNPRDQQLLEAMCRAKNGREVRRLWEGDWSGYSSHSEADLALCNHLAFYTSKDPARMEMLFRESGLYREKWEREDYRTKTIDLAISSTVEVYGPNDNQREDASLLLPPSSDPRKVLGEAPLRLLEWESFWERDCSQADWLYPEVLARGRGHVIYAAHKVGKSLFALYIAAELATGEEPVVVLYLDYEMTEADVQERLEDMGYGPGADLSRLCYALLPNLPPLNTADGAGVLLSMSDYLCSEWPNHHLVVIIDTIGRAVAGKENDSDPFRDFYTYTGMQLKRRRITCVRLDHAGKDSNSGPRGTSAKGDDVDVVWQLKRSPEKVTLNCDVARMPWIPRETQFILAADPVAFHRVVATWPTGTEKVADLLDDLGVPLNASSREGQGALKAAGEGKRREVVVAALRWRHERVEKAGAGGEKA